MCSYATAAMTLLGAQQPRLAPVLPARCSRAVTAGLQFVRVTAALTLLGAQQPRLAPVLPPRLRQALTPGLRSARVTGALTLPGAQQPRLAPVLPPDSSRAVTNHRRDAASRRRPCAAAARTAAGPGCAARPRPGRRPCRRSRT